jgi:hypothetical protein
MKQKRKDVIKSEELFVGIDIHKRTWHVTISRQVKSRSSGLNEVHEIRYCYPVGASDIELEKSHLIKV